jgi:hypothetical protein
LELCQLGLLLLGRRRVWLATLGLGEECLEACQLWLLLLLLLESREACRAILALGAGALPAESVCHRWGRRRDRCCHHCDGMGVKRQELRLLPWRVLDSPVQPLQGTLQPCLAHLVWGAQLEIQVEAQFEEARVGVGFV